MPADDVNLKPIDYTDIMKDKTAYLSMEEIDKMLNVCLTDHKNHNEYYKKISMRNWLLIQTILRTGRRITEIVGKKPYTICTGLRPVDIHNNDYIEFDILKKNPVRRMRGKKKLSDKQIFEAKLFHKPKRVLKPVDKLYLSWLKNYIETNNIYPHSRVFPMTRKRAWEIVSNIAMKCGVARAKGKIHPHNFRHTFAIHLLKSNPNDMATLRQVQELLDHSSINITMAYAQFTQEDKRMALEKAFN
jgi:site-specific recombinase XerD